MKRLFSLLIFAIFLLGSTVSAQTSNGYTNGYVEVEDTAPVRYIYVYTNPLDQMFERDARTGILRLPDNRFRAESIHGLGFRDTLFVNPLFLPIVFSGRTLPRNFSFFPPENESDRGILIPQQMTFTPQLAQIDFAQNVRRQFYINHPTRIQLTVADLPDPPAVSQEEYLRAFNPLRGLFRTESTLELTAPTVEGVTIERRYWRRSGEHSLQFSQNYFSDNWHRPSNNHLSINSNQIIRANYHRERVRFDNTLEWRLIVQSTPDDNYRNHVINNDLMRYTGRFSVEASRNWAYSINVGANSQIFNNFPPNSMEIRSAFLSPLRADAGIGMTYRLDRRSERVRHRRVRLGLDLNPFAANFIFVNHPDVDVRRLGLDEGQRYSLSFGSTVLFEMTYDFNRFTTWTTRFRYFTNYSKVLIEFDNRLNMQLTNAFSTIIQLNARFDDNVSAYDRDGERFRFGFLQINQMLSFGLNYRW